MSSPPSLIPLAQERGEASWRLSLSWRRPTGLTPIAAIKYLKTVRPLAGNHDLGMAITELDLPNWPACCVELTENDGRSIRSASRRPAGRQVAALPDLNGGRLWVEVGLEHGFGLPRVCARTIQASRGGSSTSRRRRV
jgi:hypothetical protein